MQKQHVQLTPDHQAYLQELVSKGNLAVKTFKPATALLALNEGQTLKAVASKLDTSSVSVAAWAKGYATQQLAVWQDAPRSGRPVVISGESRAKISPGL